MFDVLRDFLVDVHMAFCVHLKRDLAAVVFRGFPEVVVILVFVVLVVKVVFIAAVLRVSSRLFNLRSIGVAFFLIPVLRIVGTILSFLV